MKKDLMIYDVDWWILGKHAKILQQHHPALDIISARELDDYLLAYGSESLNSKYRVISAMCLGLAAYALFRNLRIDSSAAVSYYYFSRNYDTFREWSDPLIPDPEFLRLVIPRISRIGGMNRKLTETIKQLAPSASVEYVGHFVDHYLFRPEINIAMDRAERPLVIGWAGDKAKKSKNYASLYEPLRNHFESDPEVEFKDTPGLYAYEQMPMFYHSIDLLLITSANEGGGAPALEAYACGKPVLSTDVGYVKEAAHPDAHGLILRSDDPVDYMNVINFYKDKSRRQNLQELGFKCRERIEANWTIENAVGRWLEVLFGI
ncbi:glycosyltransferase involved in cell wall biosynthesis [Fontibacillus phaseoli]|uniref:Glycosyltransferase involved in cell wall biosynthesis n=1 Tax=Fontibacillus phaseoli TaxID=1416533 RepID=A0A369B6K0_9BACL|nr:glycosyltransferase family 4 protein [Fontibacillus phaseoli]RCX16955.1 glycosyltransferase involved in cell wall biosynthesis [Fontibacillus phaseoli]